MKYVISTFSTNRTQPISFAVNLLRFLSCFPFYSYAHEASIRVTGQTNDDLEYRQQRSYEGEILSLLDSQWLRF